MSKGHEKEHSKTSQSSSTDTQKDTKDIANVLTILDSNIIRTNPFGANVSGDNSYRRAERISAALHLITNHVPATEPLRTSIRQNGLHLLEVLLELRTSFRMPGSEKGQMALAAIRSLVSLVRLLAVAGYISASNSSAVIEALDELGSLIVTSQRSTLSEQLTISREDLTPPARGESRVEPVRTQASAPRRSPRRPRVSGAAPASGTARADQIMDILKLGGTLGIKDIVANIPQYSEKMVQRELAELTQIGRVKKVGAKRWSRYQAV